MLMTFQITEVERDAIKELASRMERSKSDTLRFIIRQTHAAMRETGTINLFAPPAVSARKINQNAAMKNRSRLQKGTRARIK